MGEDATPDWAALTARALDGLTAHERRRCVVYALVRPVPAGAALDLGGTHVTAPRDGLVLFVDLEPELNWSHRCYYVLATPRGEMLSVVDARTPPFLRATPDDLHLVWKGDEAPAWALATTRRVARA